MKDIFSLEGRCAIVIGGGGGIGSAIAKGLAEGGAKVGISGRNAETLQKTADKIKEETGCEIEIFAADATDEESVKKLAEDFVAKMGKVDILVNSQGLNKKFSALEHPVEEWDAMFAANCRSIMLTCEYFGRYMVEQRYGRIINVSSIGAVRTKPTDISVCYGATKGAVDAYSLNLAAGWAQYGITVNCIGPIMTETEMMKPIFAKNPDLRDGTAARVPMGRIGLPEDCANIARFFASDACSFVTGQHLYADGGLMTLQ